MSLDLSRQGTRIYLHLPTNYRLTDLLSLIRDRDVVLVTSETEPCSAISVTQFQTFQLSQALIDTLSKSDPIFLIEVSLIWGQFTFPRSEGRIVAFGTDLSSLRALTDTARFLSGPEAAQSQVTPFDLAVFLKSIGVQLPGGVPVKYQGIPVPIRLDRDQYNEYLSRMERDPRSEKFSALQVTNFLYPPPLQLLHNISRERRPLISPDFPQSEGGWVTLEVINQLSKCSPKLAWISHYLQQNSGKHIIHTAFNDSNGVKIVSTILTLLGHRVVSLTGNDRQQDRNAKLELFTDILVTNLYPFSDFPDVKSLIMLEQLPSDGVVNGYLRRSISTVLFLVSFGPNDEPTIEVANYLELIRQLNGRDVLVQLLRTGTGDLEKIREWLGVPLLTGQELALKIPGPLSWI